MSNPFGGGVFIWIVSVVLTELFSHFSGDVFIRIVGVVVAIDCCDHVCCWYCLVILECVVSLLRQLLLCIVLKLDWLFFILTSCVVLYWRIVC